MKKVLSLLTAIVILVGTVAISAVSVSAKTNSEYKKMFDEDYIYEYCVQKTGKYYLKNIVEDSGQNIVVSSKKRGGNISTPISYNCVSNGKSVYYVRNYIIYKYNLSSKEESTVFEIPYNYYYYDEIGEYVSEDFDISAIYKNKIFLTQSYYEKVSVYTYDLKTKSFKKIKSSFAIKDRYKNYFVGTKKINNFTFMPQELSIYKYKSNKLTKVKRLTKYGGSCKVIGKNIYYVEYFNSSRGNYSKVIIYKCKKNGSAKKKVMEIKPKIVDGVYESIYVSNITSKSCKVRKGNNIYKYTYKTKKYKKIAE